MCLCVCFCMRALKRVGHGCTGMCVNVCMCVKAFQLFHNSYVSFVLFGFLEGLTKVSPEN